MKSSIATHSLAPGPDVPRLPSSSSNDAAADLLELTGGLRALLRRETCFAANVGRIEAGEIGEKKDLQRNLFVVAIVRACNRTAALHGSRFAPVCSALLSVTAVALAKLLLTRLIQ